MRTIPGPAAVLFDRDDTLIENVPYNGDPDAVVPMPTVRDALDQLRSLGVRIGVVTNHSGIARGMLTREQVDAVNRRVEDLLGPFDTWQVCPHGPGDACVCRKPLPGLIESAAAELGVDAERVAMIGDIGIDVEAAAAAGARGVLVPTRVTLPEEVAAAPEVAGSVAEAISLLFPGGDER